MMEASADPNASEADDIPLICSTYDHQPKSTEIFLRLGANLDLTVSDNQHDMVQQLLSHDTNYTVMAEKEQRVLHSVANHGDKMPMDILRHARLVKVDPEARDAMGKSAWEYLKDAFTMLIDSISARQRPQEDDEISHKVFYDAIEKC